MHALVSSFCIVIEETLTKLRSFVVKVGVSVADIHGRKVNRVSRDDSRSLKIV